MDGSAFEEVEVPPSTCTYDTTVFIEKDAHSSVINEWNSISIRPSGSDGDSIPGTLSIEKLSSTVYVAWIPPDDQTSSSIARASVYAFRVPLRSIQSFRRTVPTIGSPHVTLVLQNGLSLPPLYLPEYICQEFLSSISSLMTLSHVPDDPNLFLLPVEHHDPAISTDAAVGMSYLDVHDTFVASSSRHSSPGRPSSCEDRSISPHENPSPPLHIQDDAALHNSHSASSSVVLGKRPIVPKHTDVGCKSPSGAGSEEHQPFDPAVIDPYLPQQPNIATRIDADLEELAATVKDASWRVLQGFSRVTQFARRPLGMLEEGIAPRRQRLSLTRPERKGVGHVGTAPIKGISGTSSGNSSGTEQRTGPSKNAKGKDVGTDGGLHVPSIGRKEAVDQAVKKSLLSGEDRTHWVARLERKPVSKEEFWAYFDDTGACTNVDLVKEKIFQNGIEPTARQDVWKFLLGYWDWKATFKARAESRAVLAAEYETYKAQWSSITERQASRFSAFRERRSRVEKDVVRTDRKHPFYLCEEVEVTDILVAKNKLCVLRDILVTYAMFNFDIGYCQGMSDLLSPILVIMDDEVDAFWCFVGLMDRVEHSFTLEQQGIRDQLSFLAQVLIDMDPELYAHFDKHFAANLFFCFRWLLVQFRREFDFDTTMKLWDCLWTNQPSKDFIVYICAGILIRYRYAFLEGDMGFDECSKFVNGLAGSLDFEVVLLDAEQLYRGHGKRKAFLAKRNA
eukprot:Rmarinus@m.14655